MTKHKKYIIKAITIVLTFKFFLFLPAFAQAASLYLSPASGTYSVGSTFSITVKVNTNGTAINAGEGALVFDNSALMVKSVSRSGSIFTLWPSEPSSSNTNGIIDFSGGLPSPGYNGSGGKIFTVTFAVKSADETTLSFSSGAVLANDGLGTNILTSMISGAYTLKAAAVIPPAAPTKETPSAIAPTTVPPAPAISSETHPDPNKWFNAKDIKLSWSLSSDITGISILLDQKPDSNPGNLSDGLFASKSYEDITEGIWYFHLKLKNKKGWGQISHYKIQIDRIPPLPFEITIADGQETMNPQPVLLFKTEDALSGFSHYEIKIGKGDFFKADIFEIAHNPCKMPYQAPGIHSILVKAFDSAGNFSEAKSEVKIIAPPECPPPQSLSNILKYYKIIITIILAIFGLLLAFLIVGIVFFWYRIKLLRFRIKKELREVKEAVEEGLNVIKEEDIHGKLTELGKIEKTRPLTSKEKAFKERYSKKLNMIEGMIKDENKDVEDELK